MLAIGTAGVLAGCGGGATASEACQQVSQSLAVQLVEDQAVPGTGVSAGPAVAVRSPDFEHVYFVAVDMAIPGTDGGVGVWAVNDLSSPSSVFAVDGMAQEFTTWPDGDGGAAAIDVADPSVQTATECLSG